MCLTEAWQQEHLWAAPVSVLTFITKPAGVALVDLRLETLASLFEISGLVMVNCKAEPAKNVAFQTV